MTLSFKNRYNVFNYYKLSELTIEYMIYVINKLKKFLTRSTEKGSLQSDVS